MRNPGCPYPIMGGRWAGGLPSLGDCRPGLQAVLLEAEKTPRTAAESPRRSGPVGSLSQNSQHADKQFIFHLQAVPAGRGGSRPAAARSSAPPGPRRRSPTLTRVSNRRARDERPHGRSRLRSRAGGGRFAAMGRLSDAEGRYLMARIAESEIEVAGLLSGVCPQVIRVQLRRDTLNRCDIPLREANLSINEVVVTAQKRPETANRLLCHRPKHARTRPDDQHQPHHHAAPGGKSVGDQNLALLHDRIALHAGNGSGMGERLVPGRPSSWTASGWRTTPRSPETKGADLRNIRGLEHRIRRGHHRDSLGGVRRPLEQDCQDAHPKGKSPFIVEMTLEPKTQQIALSKGFVLGKPGIVRPGFSTSTPSGPDRSPTSHRPTRHTTATT